jgi:hypothetical protein
LALALAVLIGLAPGSVVTASTASAAPSCPVIDPTTHLAAPLPTPGIDWSGCNLDRADLRGASIVGANLNGASLIGATFQDTVLDGITFVNAILTGASFRGARLWGANLTGAHLDGVSLQDATLSPGPLQAEQAFVTCTDTGILGTGMPEFTPDLPDGWTLTPGIPSGLTLGAPIAPCPVPEPEAFASGLGPPSDWLLSQGRSIGGSCPKSWSPSWAWWPNGGRGGFVCDEELYWNAATQSWLIR